MFQKIKAITEKIKKEKPLLLTITNEVTVNFLANGLLSLGASPVMSKAEDELEDFLNLAQALIINLGTLDEKMIHLCKQACRIANDLKKPIILDPVGAGASHYRTKTFLNFLKDYAIAIVRGNASEIMALSGSSEKTKGVDAVIESESVIHNAKWVSSQFNAAVLMSGKTDVVVDADKITLLHRGSHLMPMITGTGCLLSAVSAAFYAVHPDRFESSACAALFYGICGEIAAEKASGPGSFGYQFLDALHAPVLEHHYESK